MTKNQIIDLQKRIGTEADGFWGPKSIAACQRHLRRLRPAWANWPSPSDSAMIAYYGQPGDESDLVNLRVDTLGVYYEGKKVNTIRCHKKCASFLYDALEEINDGPAAWVLREYAGCFNFRNMRGGSRYSKHAWGAAIDLVPATNGLNTHWPTRANMPIDAMEAFARQGWLSAGAMWSRDAMHFQMTI